MQTYFNQLADVINARLQGDEVMTSGFSAEDSDFVRFNKSEVRQAGSVSQRSLGIDLIEGRKHSAGSVTLSGDLEDDTAKIERLIKSLREKRRHLPEDPYLNYATEVKNTESFRESTLPDGKAAIADIQKAGRGRDLVGIYAAGGIHSGFANSLGQRNWHSTYNYNFDWSFYHQADKAVKSSYAGFEWDDAGFTGKVDWATKQLEALQQKSKTIDPGRYRVYLTPAALYEIMGMLGWGGFGLKSHRTKSTPLLKMVEGDARMSDAVTILENTKDGVAANFQGDGFLKPDQVTLIEKGAYKGCLVNPRSAKEYDVACNGASGFESPEAYDVAPGELAQDQALSELGTGLYVGNLHYLNWSDRPACRTTGMTRFATFWVEDGEIAAPLNVMRFDETAYRVLGENLISLTKEREMIMDPLTYFQRSTSSARLPGALVEDFTFTL